MKKTRILRDYYVIFHIDAAHKVIHNIFLLCQYLILFDGRESKMNFYF